MGGNRAQTSLVMIMIVCHNRGARLLSCALAVPNQGPRELINPFLVLHEAGGQETERRAGFQSRKHVYGLLMMNRNMEYVASRAMVILTLQPQEHEAALRLSV